MGKACNRESFKLKPTRTLNKMEWYKNEGKYKNIYVTLDMY